MQVLVLEVATNEIRSSCLKLNFVDSASGTFSSLSFSLTHCVSWWLWTWMNNRSSHMYMPSSQWIVGYALRLCSQQHTNTYSLFLFTSVLQSAPLFGSCNCLNDIRYRSNWFGELLSPSRTQSCMRHVAHIGTLDLSLVSSLSVCVSVFHAQPVVLHRWIVTLNDNKSNSRNLSDSIMIKPHSQQRNTEE